MVSRSVVACGAGDGVLRHAESVDICALGRDDYIGVGNMEETDMTRRDFLMMALAAAGPVIGARQSTPLEPLRIEFLDLAGNWRPLVGATFRQDGGNYLPDWKNALISKHIETLRIVEFWRGPR